MKTKQAIIDYMNNNNQWVTGRIIFKVIDQSNRRFSPEKYCYRIHFTCGFTRERVGFNVYPDTVGYQGIVK
jgi:hypothetical protein